MSEATGRGQAFWKKDRHYRDHHVVYSLGATSAGLGDAHEAMQWLREAARTGFLSYGWYEQDPLLKPLRNNAEFAQLIAQMKRTSDQIAESYAQRGR